MTPTQLPAALTAAGGAAASATLFTPADSITFPLIGYRKGYGVKTAANEAWSALYQYFNPTLAGVHSESLVAGINAAALALLTAARRNRFQNIYLTIPNGYTQYNQAPAPRNTRAKNIYGVEMGAQEHAWILAFL